MPAPLPSSLGRPDERLSRHCLFRVAPDKVKEVAEDGRLLIRFSRGCGRRHTDLLHHHPPGPHLPRPAPQFRDVKDGVVQRPLHLRRLLPGHLPPLARPVLEAPRQAQALALLLFHPGLYRHSQQELDSLQDSLHNFLGH